MTAPWYCKAYDRLEREIKTSLETIAGDTSRVKTVMPEILEGICGGPAPLIFEIYDATNNLAAKVSLGHIPKDKKQQLLFESEDLLFIHTYHADFTRKNKLKQLVQAVGDVGQKVETYAQEWLDLGKQVSKAEEGTILRQPIGNIDFLKPYAKQLSEARGYDLRQFYDEAKWNQKGIAEAFSITEKDVDNLVAQIRAQLPQTYLELEKKLDEF